jgi:ubiquinone/menaquinone biosynthesis C-methylase UbiE
MKFDPAKAARLDDPERFETIKPDVMWHALGDPEPSVIVEIGAGTGLFSARFSQMAPGATVYAVDASDVMLDYLRAHRPEVAAGRIVPVLSTETQVPLPDQSADLVVMINLHHELEDPGATYAEALRLLRPGGKVLVADWAPRETPHGPPVAIRVHPDDLVRFLETAGFAEVRLHGGLPWHTLATGERS